MQTRLVSGTTLFHIAAKEYGDATQWWRIARANPNLVDTIIGAVTEINLPPPDPSIEGVGLPTDY